MLEEEKRFRALKFLAMGLQKLPDAGRAMPCAPMCADKLIALHILHVDGLILLFPVLLPVGGAVVHDGFGRLHMLALRLGNESKPVGLAFNVVIAVDEESLHVFAVGQTVLGKHTEPRVSDELHLSRKSVVSHVTGYQHGINASVSKIAKRLREDFLITRHLYVDVAEHAEGEFGRSHLAYGFRKALRVKSHGTCKEHAGL